MPALKDKLYYSSIKLVPHGETEDDREMLVQEQRYFRSRARKLSQETNRRRKALEEKRKKWDFQEQRLRENILQQRQQKVQDATENFQRAHLPPSQRKRPTFKGRSPNIDEALHHIQSTPRLYTHQPPFLASAFTISRSGTPSPKPPGGARHLRALSADEAYTKLMQGNSFKNNQLFFFNEQKDTKTALKEKDQTNTQEYLDTPHSETESLSSLDSLENGDPHQSRSTTSVRCSNLVCCSHQNSNCVQSSNPLMDPPKAQDHKRSSSPSRQSNSLCSSPHTSYSVVKSFLEEVLIQEHNPSQRSPSPRAYESAERSRRDQSQSFDTQCAPGCQNELIQHDLAANSEHMTHYNGSNTQENILKDRRSVVAHCKTQTMPDTTPLKFSNLTEEFKSESKLQMKTLEEEYFKRSSVCQTSLSVSRCKHSNHLFETFSDAAAHLNVISQTDQISNVQPQETQSSLQSYKHKPDVDTASGLKTESKPLTTQETVKICPSDPKIELEITKMAMPCVSSSKNTEEPDTTSAEAVTHPAPNSSNVQFLKGILKNHLKTKPGNVRFAYTPGHLLFTKDVAILIRDSVELARAKINEPEQNGTIKKKLRWFDEVNGVDEVEVDRVFKDPSKQTVAKSGHAYPPQQAHKQPSADHQEGLHSSNYVNLLTGVSKNISNKTACAPAGPQSTRQAWTDAGPQDSRTQEHTREPPSQKEGLCIGGPQTPRRVRSARAGLGSITSRARKGTIIRLQSAREAQHVAKAQGKILVPRPPPKPEVAECDPHESSMYISKAAYCDDDVQLALYRDNPDCQPIAHQNILKADKDASCVTVPPYNTYSHETGSNGICSLSSPSALVDNSRCRCGENGICLDRTPTDEEITLLWHGVRNALANKDGDPQSFLLHNGLLSATPQACASLSHVTVNGDSLINGVKGASGMGGFFLSSSNVRSPIRRQSMESNMVKNRVSVENNRNQTTGTVQRKNSFQYQISVPRTQHPYKSYADSGEVTDGGHDAVDWVRSHKPSNTVIGPQNQRIQPLSISAITLEEQKILQSLERLNHHLQYMKDTADGNPAVKNIVALAPAFNQTGENVGVTARRRGVSADNRTQTQRN